MNKVIYSLALLLFFSSYLYPQNGWVRINPGFSHTYTSVHFINENTGVACGYTGAIIKTTNGGLNWSNISLSTNINILDIAFFTPDTLIAVGSSKTIMRSTNGGASWTTLLTSPTENFFINGLVISSSTDACAWSKHWDGSAYHVYVYGTTDKGTTWTNRRVYVPSSGGIHFINPSTGWVYSNVSVGGPPLPTQYYMDLNKTVNGGENWSRIYRTNGASINAGQVYFYNESFGIITSYLATQYLSFSNSGGAGWSSGGTLPANSLIRFFHFINTNTGWMTGDNSSIYRTSNGGANWVKQNSPVGANMQKVFFINENKGWIAAFSQGILMTGTGGITGIQHIGSEIPGSFNLFQNYPNPFNPVTKIKFDIPAGGKAPVTLQIYNTAGKEIASLVNETLNPGSYEYLFDASELSSGIYFYTLTAGDYKESKVMALVK